MAKVRLGDYVRIRTGKLDANAADQNGKYPFFTCSIVPLCINTYSYDCECVLVAGNGDLNVKYYNGKFDAYQRTYIVESLDNKLLSVPYLYRFMDKYIETLRSISIGGVIKYIKLGNLTEASIHLPTIPKQNEIVDLLSVVDNLIKEVEQQLVDLDMLVKSRFIEMFHNKGYPIKDIESISFNKGEYGAQSASSEYDSNRPRYVRITDINDDGTLNDDFVSSSNLKDDDTYRLKYGDFLFARMGATVGKTYAFKSGNLIFAGYLIKFALKTDIVLPEYLSFPARRLPPLRWGMNGGA